MDSLSCCDPTHIRRYTFITTVPPIQHRQKIYQLSEYYMSYPAAARRGQLYADTAGFHSYRQLQTAYKPGILVPQLTFYMSCHQTQKGVDYGQR